MKVAYLFAALISAIAAAPAASDLTFVGFSNTYKCPIALGNAPFDITGNAVEAAVNNAIVTKTAILLDDQIDRGTICSSVSGTLFQVNLEPMSVGIGFVYNLATNTYTYCYNNIVTIVGEGIVVGSCAGTN